MSLKKNRNFQPWIRYEINIGSDFGHQFENVTKVMEKWHIIILW